jgi:hypothetical protein
VPPKSWTAWPLNVDDVPRSGEQVGPVDEDDLYTLKRKEIQRPSRELEDILMGVMLRFAKERFEAREWESPLDLAGRCSNGSTDGNVRDDTQLSEQTDSQNKMDLDEGNSDEDSSIEINSMSGRNQDETAKTHDGGDDEKMPKSSADKTLRPTVSADDERSRKILRPTIRHVLSRLDELLMALHHSRQACLRFKSEQAGSQTEPEAGNESGNDDAKNPLSSLNPSPPSRSRGRLHKILDPSEEALEDPLEPRRRSNRGRKKKVHTPLEGESEYEMKARIARLQHRTLPSPVAALKLERPVKQRRRSSTPGRKSEALLGLRDWSEVLGMAAMIGFSPEVIERTTQRCTSIFGEGMDMRSLVESARPGEHDTLKRYLPEPIPAMDEPNTRRSGGQNSGIRTSSSRRRQRQRISQPNSEIGESEDDKPSIESETAAHSGELFCPYANCVRHSQGFTRKGHLRSHLKLVHGKTGDEAAQSLKGSDDEMEGAVHVDRFLRHIRRRAGWRGGDGAPRKRKRKRKSARSPSPSACGRRSRTRTDQDLDGQDGTTDASESESEVADVAMRESALGEGAGGGF